MKIISHLSFTTPESRHERITNYLLHLSSRTNLRLSLDLYSYFHDFFQLMTIHIDLIRSRTNKLRI